MHFNHSSLHTSMRCMQRAGKGKGNPEDPETVLAAIMLGLLIFAGGAVAITLGLKWLLQ